MAGRLELGLFGGTRSLAGFVLPLSFGASVDILRGFSTSTDHAAPRRPFGGAVDIVVVQQPDGSFKSSPWYVRFGRFVRNSEKNVAVTVNDVDAGFHMRFNRKGSVRFIKADIELDKLLVTQNSILCLYSNHLTKPSPEQLASLHLKEGKNKVTFTFFSRLFGKQQVEAGIYLLKWNSKIVITDIDGTITKSDVLGQVMPLIGLNWAQSGVIRLFSAIQKNGYVVIFLSARAISQAFLTRKFLMNLKQDGEQLPDGPVVTSPDGIFPSLYREVVQHAPHEFKIACLEDIRTLFPKEHNPFYAGFGNRDTDAFSYLKVGIPKEKIFSINPKGEIFMHTEVDASSYASLHKLVHDLFPPEMENLF